MKLPSKPLSGKRIVVTRPRHQADPLRDGLAQLGAEVILMPVIEIQTTKEFGPLDRALEDLASFHWVLFTSVNAVSIVLERMRRLGIPSGTLAARHVGAIGPSTARALEGQGIEPEFVPSEFIGEAIGSQLPFRPGERILLPRAASARPTLPRMLADRGAEVLEIPIYRAVPANPDEGTIAQLARGVDAVTLTSPSTVMAFCEILRSRALDATSLPGKPVFACIGPVTGQAAQAEGLKPMVIASQYDTQGLIQALLEALREVVRE